MQRLLLAYAFLLYGLVRLNARALNRLTCQYLCAFRFAFALGALGAQFRALAGAGKFHVLHLFNACKFTFFVYLQGEFFRFQVFIANGNHGVLLDIVALFFTSLDLLCQTGQTFSIKRVTRVEILHAGLIELCQGSSFKLKTVFGQVFSDSFSDTFDIRAAFFMQLFHGHVGGCCAQGVNEFTFNQFLQSLGFQGSQTKGLSGSGNRG